MTLSSSTPGAERSEFEREEREATKLQDSILDRLLGEEPTEMPKKREEAMATRDTLSQLLTNVARNDKATPQVRRAMSNAHMQKLGATLGEDGGAEVYGHTVLDQLEKILQPERISALKERFEDVRVDVIPPERERVMEKAIMENLNIPHSIDDITTHNSKSYYFVDRGALRINADKINSDIAILSGPPPLSGKAGKVMRECRGILEEMLYADPVSKMYFERNERKYEHDPAVQKAKDSLRMLFGLLFIALAAISLAIERKKPFPTVAAIYAGLAVLTLNPKLFSGPLRTMRGQMEFIHTEQWDAIVTDEKNRPSLTGEQGADFFEKMTEDSEVRMMYTKVRDKKITSEEYYKNLEEYGIPKHHIVFLQDLEKRNPKQWAYLLYNIQRVQSTDGQTLLAEFAREGMSIDSLGELPTKPPALSAKAYTGSEDVGKILGGLGEPEEKA